MGIFSILGLTIFASLNALASEAASPHAASQGRAQVEGRDTPTAEELDRAMGAFREKYRIEQGPLCDTQQVTSQEERDRVGGQSERLEVLVRQRVLAALKSLDTSMVKARYPTGRLSRLCIGSRFEGPTVTADKESFTVPWNAGVEDLTEVFGKIPTKEEWKRRASAQPVWVRLAHADGQKADLSSLLSQIRKKSGIPFSADDLTLVENRRLATSQFLMYAQVKDGLPVPGRSLRIWTSLEDGHLIQAEAYLDPIPSLRPLHSLSQTPRLPAPPQTEAKASSTSDEFSIPVQIYPVQEEVDSTHQILPRVASELPHLLKRIPRMASDPYAPFKQTFYDEDKRDDLLGETEAGRAKGDRSLPYVKSQIQKVFDLLPQVRQ